jgi:hypothetical protein
VPTFADRGCHVVGVTDPYSRILGFLDRLKPYILIIKTKCGQSCIKDGNKCESEKTKKQQSELKHYWSAMLTSLHVVGFSAIILQDVIEAALYGSDSMKFGSELYF